MKILSYNIRGLGSKVKRRSITNLIQKENIDVACLQETKIEEMNQELCQQLWGNEEMGWDQPWWRSFMLVV